MIQADDLGAAAMSLRENLDAAAGDALLGRALRRDLDACADRAVLSGPASEPGETGGPHATPPEGGYPPPDRAVAGPRPPRPPDLTPRYEVPAADLITIVPQLTDGLVSVFGSYALNHTQRETYRTAGPCLAAAVLSAREPGTATTSPTSTAGGFTQDTLRFLAGGPPIGTGSLADHLPHEADRALWRSPGLQAAFQRCVAAALATPSPHATPPTASSTGD